MAHSRRFLSIVTGFRFFFGTFLIYQIKDLVSIIIAADTLTEFQLDSSLVRGSLHTDNVARRQQKKQKQ